jgi:hypothetical protein
MIDSNNHFIFVSVLLHVANTRCEWGCLHYEASSPIPTQVGQIGNPTNQSATGSSSTSTLPPSCLKAYQPHHHSFLNTWPHIKQQSLAPPTQPWQALNDGCTARSVRSADSQCTQTPLSLVFKSGVRGHSRSSFT